MKKYKNLTLLYTRHLYSFFLFISLTSFAQLDGISEEKSRILVGYSGSEPFVIHENKQWTGISVEIWDLIASETDLNYVPVAYENVGDALKDLNQGKLDAVVGPISITSERAELVEFSQPYFQSSLAILSRIDDPSFLDRIAPLFTINLLYALIVFLFILACVGTLLWLAERKVSPEQFPDEAVKGIANGMWCAIVTMSTTGYGDIAPVTLMGRIVAGTWMIVSILFATTMVAGIASSLTLSGLGTDTISSAEQFSNKNIAVLKGAPSTEFVKEYQGNTVDIQSLQEGFMLLKSKKVQAIVYDRPQLKYYLEKHKDDALTISVAEYSKQGYGFAFKLNSEKVAAFNIKLLKLKEEGVLRNISSKWLGTEKSKQ